MNLCRWTKTQGLTLLTLMVMGCGSPSAEQAVDVEKIIANITRKEIELDDSDPNARVALTRNFYFVFDGSGSMADAPDADCHGDQSFSSKLQGAQWAVKEFVKKIPEDINLGLYVFDNNGQGERVPLGQNNRAQFNRALDEVYAGSDTPLANAIVFAANQLAAQYKQQLGYGEYRIVVVTDGIAERIPQASIYAMELGFPIYAIGLCVEANHPLRSYATSYRAADSFEDLARGLEETLAELPDYDESAFEGTP
ncbi:MAG: VWA domain-containing protein [Acidobacteria bacterium]|nr:VWA domain-containing protein [Acidobacteriota bacterium]